MGIFSSKSRWYITLKWEKKQFFNTRSRTLVDKNHPSHSTPHTTQLRRHFIYNIWFSLSNSVSKYRIKYYLLPIITLSFGVLRKPYITLIKRPRSFIVQVGGRVICAYLPTRIWTKSIKNFTFTNDFLHFWLQKKNKKNPKKD